MQFGEPLFLLLLLLSPLFVWLGWPQRGPAQRRQVASLVIRLVLFVLLVLALARLETVQANRDVAVVYLVDVSDSMPEEAQTLAITWVRDSLQSIGGEDRAAVVLFGADALVERPMLNLAELDAVTSIPTTLETDLEEAIRLALALFPSGYGKRIVILSDGVETTGQALQAAQLAAATDVVIDVVPFAFTREQEVLVTDVRVPTRLREGEDFALEATIIATNPMQAEVRVFAGETVVGTTVTDLVGGPNQVRIPLVAGVPGFTAFRVQVTPVGEASDTFYQNNELAAFSEVTGPPRVLVVASPTDEIANPAANLTAALDEAGILYDLVGPAGLPGELAVMAEYASVVLVDVPARQLSNRQMETVEQYVRDLGGGLVAIGGTQSFGVGGYYATALERALPVDMQLKDEQRRPRLTLVFIIDKSGSMTDVTGGVTKLDLAKEATIRSIELLSPQDRVGVIAFDDLASWVVPITDLADKATVINQVATIQPGGGTDIFAGVRLMADVLPNDEGQIKHVILLTDGGASEVGIAELVERLYTDNGITFSTVGVGQGAAAFLPQLAQVGGGRYHFAGDAASIPSIFTEETVLATRAYLIEEEFFPLQASSSPILGGVDSVPSLFGYVGTSTKEAAQTILVSDLADGNKDPILAAWQYGLGRSVAWTSDATTRWATNWVQWPEFPRLWAQIVQYTINPAADVDISADVTRQGETALLTVDAIDQDGNYLNELPLQASIVSPSGEAQLVEMQQVAPGQYQAVFTPDEEGAYLIRVDGGAVDGGSTLGQTTGWVLSYSPEYRSLTSDPQALVRLASLTGGGVLENAEDAFERNLGTQFDTRPLWPWLLLAAVLLLPFDIAVRRLVISRRDVQQGIKLVQERVLGLAPRPAAKPSEATSRLMQAKRRAGTGSSGGEEGPPPPVVVVRPGEGEPRRAPTLPSRPVPPADRTAAPPTPTPAPPPATGGSTASSLLAKKRARQQDSDQSE